MYKCCKCGGSNNKKSIYLIPHKSIKEIVILTDKEMTVAVAQIPPYVKVFNQHAMKIIHSNFINPGNHNLQSILCGSQESTKWVKDLVGENIFQVVDYSPKKQQQEIFKVKKGDAININSKSLKVAKAEYSGMVSVNKIENTTIYFYMSDTILSNDTSFEHAQSGMLYQTMGISLYPQINTVNAGPTCEVCKGCGGCLPCLACLACEEINFFSGVLSTISLSSSLRALHNSTSNTNS